MNTRITSRKATTLTEVEYKRLRRLTLGKNGVMRGVLEDLYYGTMKTPHRLYLVRNVENKEIIAWALVFRWVPKSRDVGYFYVPTKYRRDGIATRLMRQALKDYPKILVEAWDTRSDKFFRTFNVKIEYYGYNRPNLDESPAWDGIVYRQRAKANGNRAT